MLDLTRPIEWIGSSGVIALVTYFFTRKDTLKKAQGDDAARRFDEAMELRAAIKEDNKGLSERVDKLETWKEKAAEEIDNLRTERLKLIADIAMRDQRIVEFQLKVVALEHDAIEFATEIKALNEQIATLKGEKRSLEERLEAIKEAQKRGELGHPVLFQNKKAGEEDKDEK